MNTPLTINQGDAGIKLEFFCVDEDNAPVNLTQFSVDFLIYNEDNLINEGRTACTKPDSAAGMAEYTLHADDTLTPGIFQAKLRLANGATEVHNLGDLVFQVVET